MKMYKQDNIIYIYSFSSEQSNLYDLYENSIFKQIDEQLLIRNILKIKTQILGYDNQLIYLGIKTYENASTKQHLHSLQSKTNQHFITDLIENNIFINNGKLYEAINLYRKPHNDFLIKTYLQYTNENV